MNRQFVESLLGVTHQPYAWTIDTYPETDGFRAEPEGTELSGPGNPEPLAELADALARGEGEKFRMLDDDGIPYCVGRIVFLVPEGERESEWEFLPLHDLGEAYGCTDIQYRERTEAGGTRWVSI